MEETKADILLVGHLHEPMLRAADDLLVVHSGSVGWPRLRPDGLRAPVASFAVLDCNAEGSSLSFHWVRYPFERLRRDVIEGGMPNGEWYLPALVDAVGRLRGAVMVTSFMPGHLLELLLLKRRATICWRKGYRRSSE